MATIESSSHAASPARTRPAATTAPRARPTLRLPLPEAQLAQASQQRAARHLEPPHHRVDVAAAVGEGAADLGGVEIAGDVQVRVPLHQVVDGRTGDAEA